MSLSLNRVLDYEPYLLNETDTAAFYTAHTSESMLRQHHAIIIQETRMEQDAYIKPLTILRPACLVEQTAQGSPESRVRLELAW